MNNIKSVVAKNCANYFNQPQHYCCREISGELVCIFFTEQESPRCRYFEKYILPMNEEVAELYYDNDDEKEEIVKKPKKQLEIRLCKMESCEKEFLPKSNRQKYCEKCKIKIKNEKNKGYVKRIRNKKASCKHLGKNETA